MFGDQRNAFAERFTTIVVAVDSVNLSKRKGLLKVVIRAKISDYKDCPPLLR
jgi:hypothetical protein